MYYYITVLNENYAHPAMPEGCEDGIRKGMYLLRDSGLGTSDTDKARVQFMGSGSILREVIAAADLLAEQYGIDSDIWSVPSFNEIRREAHAVTRANRLRPESEAVQPYITGLLDGRPGPVVAATDYIRAYADQVREYVPQDDYYVLGTDGFGRSDTREQLRRFFEVDRNHVAWTALVGLNKRGQFSDADLKQAREDLGIDPDKPFPLDV